jgi:hypothetical protein
LIFPAQPKVQLPKYGEVFKVSGHIQMPVDQKYNRRAVVVGVPLDLDGRIRIVTRTSDEERQGVPSRRIRGWTSTYQAFGGTTVPLKLASGCPLTSSTSGFLIPKS